LFDLHKEVYESRKIKIFKKKGVIKMKSLQKFGGFAALYMALAHLMGLIIFIVILDYISITDLAQKVAMNVDNQEVVFSTNLLMYVFFGFFLIVFSLALYNRLKAGAPAIMQVATVIGVIWAGSLIASGMVANAALTSVVAIYVTDPTQAALTWQGIEPVIDGLGNANGEILGGLMTLLISLAALRAGELPKGLNILGLVVGTVGIISLVPMLTGMLGPVFGLTQIIWFIWMGIALIRSGKTMVA
jgi:hypothetical protein